MNKNKIIASLIIFNLILIVICLNYNRNIVLRREKQIIKEMSDSEQVTSLNKTLDDLNEAHQEYASNVENYKKKIAEAITNEGIITTETATANIIVNNIEKIFEIRTTINESTAATASDILEGKKAYVNGKLIIGTTKASSISPELVGTSHIKGTQKTTKTYTSDELAQGQYIVFVMSTVYNSDDGTVYSVYCGSDYTTITINTDSINNSQQIIYEHSGATRGEAYWVLLDIKTPSTITIEHTGLTGYKSAFHADIIKLD